MVVKLFSWNVNGIRAVLKKGALQSFIDQTSPDILCLQETKAKIGQAETDFLNYQEIWNSAQRPGYSGTAIFSKTNPLTYSQNLGNQPEIATILSFDTYGHPLEEGRIQVAEYSHFFLVNVYTPNSKPDLSRLNLRHQIWDPSFLKLLKTLEQTKPVVVCGDFNAAHTEIDLARPKTNTKSAGFTIEERQGITNLIKSDFIDTFRFLNPQDQRYTWWSHWGNARANNVGWRIDYFFISKNLIPHLKSAEIHENFLGSDHCPISIELEF